MPAFVNWWMCGTAPGSRRNPDVARGHRDFPELRDRRPASKITVCVSGTTRYVTLRTETVILTERAAGVRGGSTGELPEHG